MKNLIVKTNRFIQESQEVPEYFHINDSQYYRIVNKKSYVVINFKHYTQKEVESLLFYPTIEMKMVAFLHIHIVDQDMIPITKEEFDSRLDMCYDFIASI